MKIAVIGSNYVGLVVATCLANTGHDVVGVDIKPEIVAKLNRGESTIYEPGLSELLTTNLNNGRLLFTLDHCMAVARADICFLAVGTPSADDGSVNMSHLLTAAAQVAEAATARLTVVIKSTVPVGTADRVRQIFAERCAHPAEIVSNPEFLKEGTAIADFQHPDRVVVGTDSEKAAEQMRELYAPFVRTGHPVLVMGNRSAELTKYAANALLATRISFMNEMANLADAYGVNIHDVRRGIGTDRRIGTSFLFSGVGYGGSCFPKDVSAISHMGQETGVPTQIVNAVTQVNADQKRKLGEKVLRYFGGDLTDRTIAVWGLAFKPKTDDMRDAPSRVLVEQLLAAGATVVVTDPVALDEAWHHFGDRVQYESSAMTAAVGADAVCLVTEWQPYRFPDFGALKASMRTAALFDGRNIWDGEKRMAEGFDYFGMGTPSSHHS